MADQHMVDDTSLNPHEDGWYRAGCTCGWTFGAGLRVRPVDAPLPSTTEVVDVIMEHAYFMGQEDAAGESDASDRSEDESAGQ